MNYGYATGVLSNHQIERARPNSAAFRFITSGVHPDHETLTSFRRRYIDDLAGLFA